MGLKNQRKKTRGRSWYTHAYLTSSLVDLSQHSYRQVPPTKEGPVPPAAVDFMMCFQGAKRLSGLSKNILQSAEG